MRIIRVLFIAIFLSSLLYMNNSFNRYFIFGFVILIPMILFMKKNFKLKIKSNLIVLYSMYFLFGGISSLKNQDIELLLGALFMFVIFLTLSIIIPSGIESQKYLEVISRSVLWSHLPIIFIPLLVQGLSIPYKGIFNNGNSFGIAIVMVFCIFSAKLFSYMDDFVFHKANKFVNRNTIFIFVFLAILFVLGIYSGSRTATITNITILLVNSFNMVLKSIKKLRRKSLRRLTKSIITVLLSLLILFVFTPIKDIFLNVFINKFIIKINQGNILSYRQFIWIETIKDATLFGNGRDYFVNTLDVGAHNTFISLLGQYGWATVIIFMIIVLIAFKHSFKYSSEEFDSNKYLPISIWVSFFMLSMGEGMLLKVNMIAMICIIGITKFKASTTIYKLT